MATDLKSEEMQQVHSLALRQFDDAVGGCEEQREESLEDRKFYSIRGAQWDGLLGEQFVNKTRLEFNKVHLAVMRVINEYRNNKITADFVSKEGNENDELADLCDDLYRADEQDSGAEEAYDNAFEEAAGGGFGAWRLTTEYEDEYDDDDDRQRIRFEPIYDADTTVYFDSNAKRHDKSDAMHAFVLTGMSREAFEDTYDESPSSWDRPTDDLQFDWCTPDLVYIAEYYKVEETNGEVFRFRDLAGSEEKYTEDDFDNDNGLRKRLNQTGWRQVGKKRVKRRRVHKYIMSGGGILEDCGYIAGTEIPIIPVYGKRWFVDGLERFMGVVRLAKDAQRLKNMQMSVLGDMAARGGISKPIVAPEQVAGLEAEWANDAVDNFAYLRLNPIYDQNGQMIPGGPLGYTKAPEIPHAMAALLQMSDTDMEAILGNQEAGEQVDTQLSGRAIELVQNRLDMQSLIYMSNFAKAIRRCGEVWLSMARDVYDEDGRKMKVISSSGKMSSVELGGHILDDQGKVIRANDLSRAKFDVVTDVGPSSSSKRAATVRAVTSMIPLVSDPADAKVLTAVAMKNLEGQGVSGLNEYFRRQLVQLGVEEPTDEEREEMEAAQQGQQPDPNAVYLEAEAQKSLAMAAKAEAETGKVYADTELSKAKAVETLAGIDQKERAQSLEAAKLLNDTISGASAPRPAGTMPPR